MRRWPKTLALEIAGLGHVLFCHGTPRSEVECFTRLTSEHPLGPVFEGVPAAVVVCGHGQNSKDPVPQATEFAEQYVLTSPPEKAMLEAFTNASFR